MKTNTLTLIRKLNKNIKNSFLNGKEPEVKINYTQFQIVAYLFKHGDEEVCQKDLEIETHLNKASIAATIDSLEDKGVVDRVQSQVDKRKNVIVLTEVARRKHLEFKQKMDELEKQVLTGIDKKDLDIFYEVIDKMNENLERKNK